VAGIPGLALLRAESLALLNPAWHSQTSLLFLFRKLFALLCRRTRPRALAATRPLPPGPSRGLCAG
jgi:hypothetical protein